jgi:ABC-type Fe3+ transport system permease subunit
MNASAKEKKAKGGDFAPIEHMALCDIMLALIAEKEKNGEQIHSQQKHTFSKSCRAEPGIVVGLGFFVLWMVSVIFILYALYILCACVA